MPLFRQTYSRVLSGQVLLILFCLSGLSFLSILFSLSVGSIDIDLSQVFAALLGGAQTMEAKVILELRLPRILSGFIVGGLLALAGALMQVLLRNPLAEPYVLGVSGGGIGICAHCYDSRLVRSLDKSRRFRRGICFDTAGVWFIAHRR